MINKDNNSVWKDRFYMILPAFLVVLVILNVVSFFVNRDKMNGLKDRYSVSYSAFTNELVNLRSSYLSTASNIVSLSVRSVSGVRPSVPTNSVSDSFHSVKEKVSIQKDLCVKTCPYRYLLYNGRRVIQYYGRIYEEGSPMSLGRITRIFPDRVYFDDGTYMENTRNPDVLSQPSFAKGYSNNE